MKDVFLCHASEDKDTVVLPIAESLRDHAITYWLDKAEINWGDSLVEKINHGLSTSRYVIVVLSDSFLSKRWPQRELNSVLSVEASTGDVKVLPLIVGDHKQILANFALLDDKTFIQWQGNPSEIAKALKQRLASASDPGGVSPPDSGGFNIPLPKVKRHVTQREKDLFLKRAFEEILAYFKEALARLESHHEGIETDIDEVHKFKFVCKVYLDGEVGAECKIWLGGHAGNGISYAEGRNIDFTNDNSFNDWVSVEDDGSKVYFETSGMNRFQSGDNRKLSTGIEAAEHFWRRLITTLE